jgi:hypothetical protein
VKNYSGKLILQLVMYQVHQPMVMLRFMHRVYYRQ